ncbi:hypothetical protein XA68_15993 [Ophiocordyceps unilateralis]|uniref:Tubby C-terminal domain-containing protein n=1 Tax=Ophiocordyceps unilateralis TaxID=268505 RepID=A0A2A9PK35_OPHUN|nr:hypothetical protein XA68_15993 [Ophiocordyceps unilateralis]
MHQLPPAPRPLGVFNNYMAKGPETLVLKEKMLSLSGDSFDIKLASGQPMFKVAGRHMTVSGRKSVYDSQGNKLFDIVKEHLHLHKTYAAQDAQGKVFLTVKSSMTCFGSKATAEFTSPEGRRETLTMRGDWLDKSVDIMDSGTVVAAIDRKVFNVREVLGGQQTYALHVAPGVDMALMIALCVAFDEANND